MLRIKELRESKGLNMKEAARILNMPYTTYVNYEKGLREPTSEVLIQLASFYHTSVDFIVGRDCIPSTKQHDFNSNISNEFGVAYYHSDQKNQSNISSEDMDLINKFHMLDGRSQKLILDLIDHEIESQDDYEELLGDSTIYDRLYESAIEEAKHELLSQYNDWDDV